MELQARDPIITEDQTYDFTKLQEAMRINMEEMRDRLEEGMVGEQGTGDGILRENGCGHQEGNKEDTGIEDFVVLGLCAFFRISPTLEDEHDS